jgi:acetyltransferase-like isoleucine patch superfamily enzyme
MAYFAKKLVRDLLMPFAIMSNQFNGIRKIWAHTRLATQVNFPLDPSVVVLDCPEIHGTRNICLGKNLLLYREVYFETQGSGEILLEDEIVLSRGVHLVSFSKIHIGRGTMIGEYSSIRDANHRISKELMRYSGHETRPIIIGKNVWIGRGVTILPGVTIGDNAVIGANAVVTQDIAERTIAVGMPARPMKFIG